MLIIAKLIGTQIYIFWWDITDVQSQKYFVKVLKLRFKIKSTSVFFWSKMKLYFPSELNNFHLDFQGK